MADPIPFDPPIEQRVRVLEIGHRILIDQVADLVIGQRIINEAVAAGTARMDTIGVELSSNTGITREIRDLMTAAKVGFCVLGWLGRAVKWGGIVATAVAAIWTAFYMATHGGKTPL